MNLAIMSAQDIMAAVKFFKEMMDGLRGDTTIEGLRAKEFFGKRIAANMYMLEKYQINTMQVLAPGMANKYLLGPQDGVQLVLPFASAVEAIEDIKLHTALKAANTVKEVKEITWKSQNSRVSLCREIIEKFLNENPLLKHNNKNTVVTKMWEMSNENKDGRFDPIINLRKLVFNIYTQSSISTANQRAAQILKDWTKEEIAQFVAESVYYYLYEAKEVDIKDKKIYNPIDKTEMGEVFEKLKKVGGALNFNLKRESDVLRHRVTQILEKDAELQKLKYRKNIKADDAKKIEEIETKHRLSADKEALKAYNLFNRYSKSPYQEKGFEKPQKTKK